MRRKYRYRESWGGGVTNRSLTALDKHIAKIGTLEYIKGYQYEDGKKIKHIAILVKGSLGSLRLGGFSWGYAGEGPRGTKTLMAKLNVPQAEIDRVIATPWDGWVGSSREFWRVTI